MKKKLQKKRTLIAVVSVAALAVIGGTIAYNMNSGSIASKFNLGQLVTETYDILPDDSLETCGENPKTVYGKNKTGTPVAVRMKFEDYWKVQNSTTLNDHTSDLPLVNGDSVRVAQVVYQNQGDWTYDSNDGWYYYNYLLGNDQQTSSPIRGVQLDCSLNFGGENNECTSANGVTTCTRSNNEYEGANYHVFVTVQYLQGDRASADWGKDLRLYTLYDYVAERTNGIDTNVDFSNPPSSGQNGDGVNTLAAHANDEYPVYYYRGTAYDANNYVIFADKCWRMMRTTGTGGVKLIYWGLASNGTCGYSQSLANKRFYDYDVNTVDHDLGGVGYMRNSSVIRVDSALRQGSNTYTYSNDISRNGDEYTLDTSEGQSVTGTWSSTGGTAMTRYRYICMDGGTTCSNPAYILESGYNNSFSYVSIAGYNDIEDVKAAAFKNEKDSYAKETVDAWYEDNGISNYKDMLEDTVFCNDRSIVAGVLQGKDAAASDAPAWFGASRRVMGSPSSSATRSPSVDCPQKNDAFTVNDQINGNGALKYKIGLVTADEAMMAGVTYDNSSVYTYLSSDILWTMTPYELYDNTSYVINMDYRLSYNMVSTGRKIRPVVSLKHETFISEGDATAAHPLILHW